jgi:GT2 family glycosyltransferase
MNQLQEGVEIIIVNWNTRQLLEICLTSVFEQTPPELPATYQLQVTVVDNASSDDSVQMVEQKFPQVCLIRNPQNSGFAAGNNLVLRQSRLSHLVLLNSDTIVLKGWLRPLLDFMEQDERVGICGPRLLNADYTLQTSCRDFSRPWRDFLNKLELYRWPSLYAKILPNQAAQFKHDQTKAVDWLVGACLLVRGSAYAQVGLMDEGYFFYAEEMDWCYRFKQAGWQIWFVPQPKVIHLGGQSSKSVPYNRIVWQHQGQIRFYRKFYTKLAFAGLVAGDLTTNLLRILVLVMLLGPSKPEKREHRWKLLKTYWKVLWLPLRNQKN